MKTSTKAAPDLTSRCSNKSPDGLIQHPLHRQDHRERLCDSVRHIVEQVRSQLRAPHPGTLYVDRAGMPRSHFIKVFPAGINLDWLKDEIAAASTPEGLDADHRRCSKSSRS